VKKSSNNRCKGWPYVYTRGMTETTKIAKSAPGYYILTSGEETEKTFGDRTYMQSAYELEITKMDIHNRFGDRRIGTWAVEIVRNNGYYAPELTDIEFKTYAEAKAYAQDLLGWITEEAVVV
jgi:hypothetical protein